MLPWVHSGGVERLRLTLAERLDPERFEQRVVTMSASPSYVERFARCGVAVETTGQSGWTTGDLDGLRRVAAVIADWAPHVVHGAVFEGASMAVRAGRLCGVPVIVTEETSHPTTRSWRGHLLYAAITRMAHHTIAVSPWVHDYLTSSLKVPASRVSMILNGADERTPPADACRAAARDRLGIEEGAFVVGTVCRMDNAVKRVTDLLDAFAAVLRTQPRARLVLVGAGKDLELIRDHASTVGVSSSVVFTGRVDRPDLVYDAMDVFALLSRHEAFGLVLAEAMFAGLPVVATAVGGMVDIVDEGVTGYLVEPFHPEMAAVRLLELGSDAARRRRMGAAGYERARSRYGSGRYAAEVSGLYEALLRQRGVDVAGRSR